jgi:hypothetical protein
MNSSNEQHEWEAIFTLAEPGTHLEALRNMRLASEDGGERVFTAGKRYKVKSVFPMRDPPAAIVIDDTGRENQIEASFLGNFRVSIV